MLQELLLNRSRISMLVGVALVSVVPTGLWLFGVESPFGVPTTQVHFINVKEESIWDVELAKGVWVQSQPDKREAVLRLPRPSEIGCTMRLESHEKEALMMKEETERVLQRLFKGIGWKVRVEWKGW